MRIPIAKFGWGGLNTKAQTTGLPLLECVALQDMRVVGTDLVQRLGIVRTAQFTGNAKAMDFNGTDEYLSNAIDTRVWALGMYWTVEVAVELDVTTGTQGILTAGHTTPSLILDMTSTNIRCRVWDSAGTATTITVGAASTSVQTVQVTRSAGTISTRLNNGTAVTGSIDSTKVCRTPVGDLRVALDDTTNYMNGTVDYVRAFAYTKTDHNDRLVRHPAPRAGYVLADYDMNGSAGGLVYDRSRYGNHLIAQNSPTEVTSLCHNPAPVRALGMVVDEVSNKKQMLVAAGGLYYLVTVD